MLVSVGKFTICYLLLAILLQPVLPTAGQDTNSEKQARLAHLQSAGIDADDLTLIETNIDQLSLDQLAEIDRFTTDPQAIASINDFDVSAYKSWDEYNFYRPLDDTVVSILGRRDLFLDPARELNNPALTHMSPEALAALAFSQVYVEEKWDHQPPWDSDPNPIFNWVQPELMTPPDLFRYLNGDYLYQERTAYWWATYWSLLTGVFGRLGIGRGTDEDAALANMRPPNPNAPRLAGYGYPLGNQLYIQTAETVYWYADYLKYGTARYGAFDPKALDTRIRFPDGSADLLQTLPSDWDKFITAANREFSVYPGLLELFRAPFSAALRVELTQPESAAFWNVMRYLYAGARQREGGASPEYPQNGQPAVIALRYAERTSMPVGRAQSDVSAFALLTTVYFESILLDFTNWDDSRATLIHIPSDQSRSDGLDRQVSERNKAILVIEQMGDENAYPNATHISGSRGLGFSLVTQYDDPTNADFLPYTPQEAKFLVMALSTEARDYGLESSRAALCNSPLLKRGYDSNQGMGGNTSPDWSTVVGNLCI